MKLWPLLRSYCALFFGWDFYFVQSINNNIAEAVAQNLKIEKCFFWSCGICVLTRWKRDTISLVDLLGYSKLLVFNYHGLPNQDSTLKSMSGRTNSKGLSHSKTFKCFQYTRLRGWGYREWGRIFFLYFLSFLVYDRKLNNRIRRL